MQIVFIKTTNDHNYLQMRPKDDFILKSISVYKLFKMHHNNAIKNTCAVLSDSEATLKATKITNQYIFSSWNRNQPKITKFLEDNKY